MKGDVERIAGESSMRPKSPLYVRADASEKLGTGHVMRTLALAERWMEGGGEATYIMARSDEPVRRRIESTGAKVRTIDAVIGSSDDARMTLEQCSPCDWLVIDGYNFGPSYQEELGKGGQKTLMVDDLAKDAPYSTDIILNYNFYARPGLYSERKKGTELLLGPSHLLLRKEFWNWRGKSKEVLQRATRIMITVGGSDPHNVTTTVLGALERLPVRELEIKAISGASNSHLEDIKEAAARSPHDVEVLVNTGDMPSVMAWADLAISGAGTTSLELAFMGVPSIIVEVASNQRMSAQSIEQMGLMHRAGWYGGLTKDMLSEQILSLLGDRDERARLSHRCQESVDGLGVDRVFNKMVANAIPTR